MTRSPAVVLLHPTSVIASIAALVNRLIELAAHKPDGDALLETTPFVVLDTELTGLDPAVDDILAIGAVRMVGARILAGETFYRLVRPRQAAWARTVPVHRIFPDDVEQAPPAEEVIAAFVAFSAGALPVGHVIEIDRRFLMRNGLPRLNGSRPNLWIDTARIASWLASTEGYSRNGHHPGQYADLDSVARALGVPVTRRHHALGDAYITALVWQQQLHLLRRHGVHRLRDLALLARE